MARFILIEGNPGSGKSRSLVNLDPKTTVILSPNTKDLPFRGARKMYNKENKNFFFVQNLPHLREFIQKINSGTKIKTVVVEDFGHLLGQRVIDDAGISGYNKWTTLAVDAFKAVIGMEKQLRDDLYVILIAHTTTAINSDGESETFMLTPGKLLDNIIKIPSYFTYVFHSIVLEDNGKVSYKFLTNRDGSGKEAKSPEGCLDLLEDNDLKRLIDKIEAYQNGEEYVEKAEKETN